MATPDCTLVTGCFCLRAFHEGTRGAAELLSGMSFLLSVPCRLVIFCDPSLAEPIRAVRSAARLAHLTEVIPAPAAELWSFRQLAKVRANRDAYWPTRDARTCPESHLICCNKFDFLLRVMEANPFQSSRFAWIDCTVGDRMQKICENYTQELFFGLLGGLTEKVHIQILNAVDERFKDPEHRREYYQQYRWVVCGSFFSCGPEHGRPLLRRLNEIFLEHTEAGYGHGEEMLWLSVLDEFQDSIVRGYGDYGQILNNLLVPSRNLGYVMYVFRRFRELGYAREHQDCAQALLRAARAGVELDDAWLKEVKDGC